MIFFYHNLTSQVSAVRDLTSISRCFCNIMCKKHLIWPIHKLQWGKILALLYPDQLQIQYNSPDNLRCLGWHSRNFLQYWTDPCELMANIDTRAHSLQRNWRFSSWRDQTFCEHRWTLVLANQSQEAFETNRKISWNYWLELGGVSDSVVLILRRSLAKSKNLRWKLQLRQHLLLCWILPWTRFLLALTDSVLLILRWSLAKSKNLRWKLKLWQHLVLCWILPWTGFLLALTDSVLLILRWSLAKSKNSRWKLQLRQHLMLHWILPWTSFLLALADSVLLILRWSLAKPKNSRWKLQLWQHLMLCWILPWTGFLLALT